MPILPNTLSETMSSIPGIPFMNGVNFGNVFIPEHFFADKTFYEANNVTMGDGFSEYSLCDLNPPGNYKAAMEDWLSSHIKPCEFAEMAVFGINVVRLPLGYWNLIDMSDNPNGDLADAERMGRLS